MRGDTGQVGVWQLWLCAVFEQKRLDQFNEIEQVNPDPSSF
jgi:hypothetical protein